jgi:hypothetical protein
MVYAVPCVYVASHLLLGAVGYDLPIIFVFVLLYQLFQYACDIRLLPFSLTYEPGNSLVHTLKKLTQVALGFLLVAVHHHPDNFGVAGRLGRL